MRKWFALYLLLSAFSLQAQNHERPKLVVGIVVDQMRQEYLYRFHSKFGEGGFKRLMNDGFVLKNAHYNYVPTYTGPGHASVYTGTTPAVHGIIGNEFYDKTTKTMVNCVADAAYTPVGNVNGNGDVAPTRLLTTTITDELKLFTQKRSKVFSVSVKDRGAVLPGGHMANGAFWYDGLSGKFISSTYYMSQLPDWLTRFNNLNLADQYLSQEWRTLLPIDQYIESGPDDTPYERKWKGKDKSTFPYNLKELRAANGNFELLTSTPFANDLLTELAKTAITSEKMGKGTVTDFFCVSYSTTDIVGHATGPESVELEDVYLRLDKNLADLFKTIDQQVGSGNYVVFLTADHGVNDVPQYLKDNRIPAGYFNQNNAAAQLKEYLNAMYPGRELIANMSNEQIFLNQEAFQGAPKTSGLDMFIVSEVIGKFLMTLDGVANYYTEGVIRQARYDEGGTKGMVTRGFHPKRSGDIAVVLEPGWFVSGSIQGTTHGSPYSYDTNVPIIFYGKGIKKGFSARYHPITDIAPTLSVLLNIKFPNGCTGQPVAELFEQ
jgi:predicted AlkP superfamily pyrophosphatase or phosphodiesterase